MIMKNKILNIFLAITVAFSAISCQESDNAIDQVFAGTTYGAILRTVKLNSGEFNSYDLNSKFDVDIEEQDPQDGALLDNVEVYLQFKGNEVLLKSIPASAFTTGPYGLPRTNVSVTLQEAVTALGLSASDYTGGDSLPVRLQLNLTDGRSFTDSDASGSLQGSYFASPYKYNTVIKCIPTSAVPGNYRFNMVDTYGDGWNGGYMSVLVDGVETKMGLPDYWGDTPVLAPELVANLDQQFQDAYAAGGYGPVFYDAFGVVTIPEGASTMSFTWVKGPWDSEVEMNIVYTKLDGTGEQTALSLANPTAGAKILSVCQ
jgi:hypothetical protein